MEGGKHENYFKNPINLKKLQKVNLREIWVNEEYSKEFNEIYNK